MANKIKVSIVGLGFGADFVPLYQKHPDTEWYTLCSQEHRQPEEGR